MHLRQLLVSSSQGKGKRKSGREIRSGVLLFASALPWAPGTPHVFSQKPGAEPGVTAKDLSDELKCSFNTFSITLLLK